MDSFIEAWRILAFNFMETWKISTMLSAAMTLVIVILIILYSRRIKKSGQGNNRG